MSEKIEIKDPYYFTCYVEANGFLFHLSDSTIPKSGLRDWVKNCVKHYTGYGMTEAELDEFEKTGDFEVEQPPQLYCFHSEPFHVENK